VRVIAVLLALLVGTTVVPMRVAHAGYRQRAFLIGGYVTDTPVPADTAVLTRLDAAGIDWVLHYGWYYAQLAGAADVTAKLELLRTHHAGFRMQALSCYEIERDRSQTGAGRLFLNRGSPPSPVGLDATLSPSRGLDGPSTLGYLIWDEPEPDDALAFTNIGLLSRWIAADPHAAGKLAFTNLFSSCIRGAPVPDADYTAYLERYLRRFDGAADPPVLSFDEYPFQVPERIDPNWFRTLRLVRDAANAHGRPGWNVFWHAMIQLSPFHAPGPYAFPATFGVVNTRWQAYTALAYGAKGLCYYQLGPAWNQVEGVWGAGIVDARGDTVADAYSQVRALDADLHHLGPWLMRLDPVATFHADTLGWVGIRDELLESGRARGFVASFDAGADSTLAGQLRDRTTGDDYLLVVSQALVATQSFTLTLASPADSLFRVDRATGNPILAGTATRTIRLDHLPPGQGELFRLVSRPR